MPTIGIVGAQNVGKSTLFNALILKRKSITYDQPGVTRDLVTERVNWSSNGVWEVTDFPGLEHKKNLAGDELTIEAVSKVEEKLEKYSLLLWVIHRRGLSAYEQQLSKILRKLKRPVWLVVNFVDDPSLESEASEFYSLGFSNVIFVSALNGRNILNLRNSIVEYFDGEVSGNPVKTGGNKKNKADNEPHENAEFDEDDGENPSEHASERKIIKLAIIGKPNAGKSTLFNTLLQKERALVFDYPGTTRDTIEERFLFESKEIVLIDTAGLRKKSAVRDSIEVFSVSRTQKAISECDAVIYLLNCTEGADRQNKSIIEWIQAESKPVVMALNKADLIDDYQKKHLEDDITDLQKQYWEFPYLFIQATEPKKTKRLVEKAISLYEKSLKTVTTSEVNKLIESFKRNSIMDSHNVKLNYATYDAKRSKFILFSNHSKLPDHIIRFIKKEITKKLDWHDIPFHIEIRKKNTRSK